MPNEDHLVRSVKDSRRKLSRSEGRRAGRKAAHIYSEESSSLTAKGAKMKRKQAFAIAASKIHRGQD